MLKVSPIDNMILAFAVVLQPTTAEEIYSCAVGTMLARTLTLAECKSHFSELERQRFLWRAIGSTYIVTPLGEQLALLSIDAKTRDKLRLFNLNTKRYLK